MNQIVNLSISLKPFVFEKNQAICNMILVYIINFSHKELQYRCFSSVLFILNVTTSFSVFN